MIEHYAKLAKSHIERTGSAGREMWRLMEGKKEQLQGNSLIECSQLILGLKPDVFGHR